LIKEIERVRRGLRFIKQQAMYKRKLRRQSRVACLAASVQ
jgi:hypothetical protein